MANDDRYLGLTPEIDETTLKELLSMNIDNLGGGVIRFPNAVDIDFPSISKWIDENALAAHQQRWKYFVDDAGNTYATNEDGNKFSVEQIEEVPVRVLNPVDENTSQEMIDLFRYWEDQIYKCLIRYIHEFPMVVGTIWWRSRGHVIRYDKGDYLGIHNDNDSNYRATGGKRYMPKGQIQMRQVIAALIYINDCVDSEDQLNGTNYLGGELFFPYLGIESKPKMGDIILFPTNYVATHGVKTVKAGQRYCYLEFFSQGSSHDEVLINVAEPDSCDGWCRPHWIDSVYDDYTKFCLEAEYGKPIEDIAGIPNPVYQNRTLEGDDGLRQPYKHQQVFDINAKRGTIKAT